jgi:hypothetical protein
MGELEVNKPVQKLDIVRRIILKCILENGVVLTGFM